MLNRLLTLTRPLIGVDLETTGKRPKTAGIVQLALRVYVPGYEVGEYKTLVNPIMPIPPEATAVHGITDEMVKDAPTFKQLSPKLAKDLLNCDFTGKNVKRYDLPLLREEFARAGVVWSYEGAAIIDAERLWQLCDPRKLDDAVNRFVDDDGKRELGTRDLHDAGWDIRASDYVIAGQLRELNLVGKTPADVHALEYGDDYDAEGKLRWLENGELALTFSDHADVPLSLVDPGFLRWMLKKDFSAKVMGAVRAALAGTPVRRTA